MVAPDLEIPGRIVASDTNNKLFEWRHQHWLALIYQQNKEPLQLQSA